MKTSKVTAYELFRDTNLISDKEFIKNSLFEFVYVGEISNQMVDNRVFTSVDLLIGPKEAKFLLKLNVRNRKMKDYHLNSLAKDMSSESNWHEDKSAWIFNAQPISFDVNGHLINGQNRLSAIIKSEKVLVIKTFFNTDSETFKVYDTGKTKNATKILDLMSISDPSKAANIVKLYKSVITGKGFSENVVKQSRRSMPNEDVYYSYLNDPKVVKSIQFVKNRCKNANKILNSTSIAGYHRIFSDKSEEDANEFIEKLCNGFGLESNSPILALRKRLLRHKNGDRYHLTSKTITKLTIYAWNKFRLGEKTMQLTLPRDFNGKVI
jgi:hypothetical protein